MRKLRKCFKLLNLTKENNCRFSRTFNISLWVCVPSHPTKFKFNLEPLLPLKACQYYKVGIYSGNLLNVGRLRRALWYFFNIDGDLNCKVCIRSSLYKLYFTCLPSLKLIRSTGLLPVLVKKISFILNRQRSWKN